MGLAKNNSQKHILVCFGGAWKVAYADFVTAMMALFMVLWISAQDEKILLATSEYFASPFNSPMDRSSGVMDGTGTGVGLQSGKTRQENSVVDMVAANELAREFYRLLDLEEADTENALEVNVTSEELQITVYQKGDDPLFDGDNDNLTQWGTFVIQNLAWLLDRHNMKIKIGAHVPKGAEDGEKGPWEITSDRVNVVRKEMEKYAIEKNQVQEISAYGDSMTLPDYDPKSEKNHRIEIKLIIADK